MEIIEVYSLTEGQVSDLRQLMSELTPDITVSAEMLENVVNASGTHLFAAIDDGHIVGCASLCVFDSPTGRKASVEDVVVLSSYRGNHIGKDLMEYLINYASRNLGDVDLHLTSRPTRVAANNLYRSLGFQQCETNVYKLKIRESVVSHLNEFIEK